MKRLALLAVLILALITALVLCLGVPAAKAGESGCDECPCLECPPVSVDLCAKVELTGDGMIDGDDLQTYIALWNDRDPAADFNHDGVVDEADLFGDWLPSNGYLDRWFLCTLVPINL